MDETIISRWNSKVKKGDLVYVIGDYIWTKQEYLYRKYHNALNGQKILVKGNHDDSRMLKIVGNLFAKITLREKIKCGDEVIIADHFPIYHWDRSHWNSYHIHGHTHNALANTYDTTGKILDVGVDGNNFYPYNIEEVLKIMRNKPDNINYLNKGFKK